MNEVIGIDAQNRGLAIARFSLPNGDYIGVNWYPLSGDCREDLIYSAWNIMEEMGKVIKPSLTVIELPTAITSSSSMSLWGIYGGCVAGIYPHSILVEGIVPTSWKKFSGLNIWAKENDCAKRGVIEKKQIKRGIIELIEGVPSTLSPDDLYDSIAIGYAGFQRNQQRVATI
jgi:hypothetical protein